jgi:hypothetical protein
MENQKLQEARTIVDACEKAGVTIAIRPVLRPAALVTKDMETAARTVADEIVKVVLEREHDLAYAPLAPSGLPCRHCRGTGRTPTALELFDDLAQTLRCLMWDEGRIVRLRDELHVDETLNGMGVRQGGVDLIDPQGRTRTLRRFDS